jgi:hypothetical protein
MIVRQQVERHRGDLLQQFVERRRVGGGRNIVAMPAPDRRLLIPGGGNRKNDRLRHLRSVACRDASQGRADTSVISQIGPREKIAAHPGSGA